jgi:hypothetical protein
VPTSHDIVTSLAFFELGRKWWWWLIYPLFFFSFPLALSQYYLSYDTADV